MRYNQSKSVDFVRSLYIVAVGLIGILLAIYGCRFVASPARGNATPDELAVAALQAETAAEKQRAAVDLANSKVIVTKHLEQLYRKSKHRTVRATSVQALGDARSIGSMDLLLDALNDPAWLVRARAKIAIAKTLDRDVYFAARASGEKRAAATQQIRKAWKNIQQRGLVEHIKQRKLLAYFFDLNTGELFEDIDSLEPVETNSGLHEGMPAGVRAYVFTCGERGDESQYYIGWITAPARTLVEYGIVSSADGAESRNATMMRAPDDTQWFLHGSPEAMQMIDVASSRCGGRSQPKFCRPGR